MHEQSIDDLSVDHAGGDRRRSSPAAIRPKTASSARRGTTKRARRSPTTATISGSIAREGFRAFLRDFLVRLNGDRLTAPTLVRAGRAGGQHGRVSELPGLQGPASSTRSTCRSLLAMLPGRPADRRRERPVDVVPRRFRVDAHAARQDTRRQATACCTASGWTTRQPAQLLAELAEDKAMPDFTVAYFADNDYRSHEVGPHEALTDRRARRRRCSGGCSTRPAAWRRCSQDTYVIITSDHGHCEILDDADRARDPPGPGACRLQAGGAREPWKDDDEIMICPNMRAAQIYLHEPTMERVSRAIKLLLARRARRPCHLAHARYAA